MSSSITTNLLGRKLRVESFGETAETTIVGVAVSDGNVGYLVTYENGFLGTIVPSYVCKCYLVPENAPAS